MIVRARWSVAGSHTHVRVFATMFGESSLGKCGDLVFRNEEWAVIGPALERGGGWQLVEDEPQAPHHATVKTAPWPTAPGAEKTT